MVDQPVAWLPGKRAISVVGIGDAAFAVSAHDKVALGLQQTLHPLFRFAEFPLPVGQFVDVFAQVAYFLSQRTIPPVEQCRAACKRQRTNQNRCRCDDVHQLGTLAADGWHSVLEELAGVGFGAVVNRALMATTIIASVFYPKSSPCRR